MSKVEISLLEKTSRKIVECETRFLLTLFPEWYHMFARLNWMERPSVDFLPLPPNWPHHLLRFTHPVKSLHLSGLHLSGQLVFRTWMPASSARGIVFLCHGFGNHHHLHHLHHHRHHNDLYFHCFWHGRRAFGLVWWTGNGSNGKRTFRCWTWSSGFSSSSS